jgi:hypothetical protein
MIEVIANLINQIVDFFVKLFYICLLIAIFGLGFLNWLGMEVEKQRRMREGKEDRQ